MRLEHVAFMVNDPEAVAEWYCRNLGMRVVNRGGGGDVFVADEEGRTILQLEDAHRVHTDPGYQGPDYAARDLRTLHIAFSTDAVAAARERLVKAGAVPVDEIIVTGSGDVMATLRDPWGLGFQLVKRRAPMV